MPSVSTHLCTCLTYPFLVASPQSLVRFSRFQIYKKELTFPKKKNLKKKKSESFKLLNTDTEEKKYKLLIINHLRVKTLQIEIAGYTAQRKLQ